MSRADSTVPAEAGAGLPRELELYQLQIFDALLREGSLTKAAIQLDMSQPTLSKVLAKLRTYFNDPLFVRVGQRMEPTPKALALADTVASVLNGLRHLRNGGSAFDPVTSGRHFALYMIDGAVVSALPRLLARLSAAAPGVRVQATQCDVRHLDLWLQSGAVDFAMGDFPALVSNIHRQPLWTERYGCVVRAGHPRISGALSLAEFCEEDHILVSTAGTGHAYADATRQLESTIPSHHVVCRIPTFTGAAHIVRHSDAIATLPRRLAESLARDLGLVVVDLPMVLPSLDISLYWHERYHRDPGNQWLRGIVKALFAD